ncbi:hypothetical protein MPSEU_000027400 [Mayamaea pseudoterrestris]|nr:hypothetical protein MPSEU_000027400 [Mayamaea pseudoterrestris]
MSPSHHYDDGGDAMAPFQGETAFETYFDIITGLAYLVTAIVSAKRLSGRPRSGGATTASSASSSSGGGETTVVTAFYSLILATSLLRALWFLVPLAAWQQPSYTPVPVFSWTKPSRVWIGAALSELVVTAGSLTLFSIFILILVYWADILKKYFTPGARRNLPMTTFFFLVGALAIIELLNCALFLARVYSTEGMILVHSVVLAVVSLVCVCEITIFSHRFRTVLQTLGAINQVSTEAQVRRIVWITVTGNLFFVTRALLETVFASMLLLFWQKHGTVQKAFSHEIWDAYTVVKYWSELTILVLMLYILQSRFSASSGQQSGTTTSTGPNGASYQKVPTADV